MGKLVVLKNENIRQFGKMPDGTVVYTVKQSSLNGPAVFQDNGEIDTFLQAHRIKFKLKDTLVNRILSPKMVEKPDTADKYIRRFEVVDQGRIFTWEDIFSWLHKMRALYATDGKPYVLESVELRPGRCTAYLAEIIASEKPEKARKVKP